jgi:hypothetical protein
MPGSKKFAVCLTHRAHGGMLARIMKSLSRRNATNNTNDTTRIGSMTGRWRMEQVEQAQKRPQG